MAGPEGAGQHGSTTGGHTFVLHYGSAPFLPFSRSLSPPDEGELIARKGIWIRDGFCDLRVLVYVWEVQIFPILNCRALLRPTYYRNPQ